MIHYYVIDIAHYEHDTRHMSLEQKGIYVSLCNEYISNEGVPIPEDLSMICKKILPYTAKCRAIPKLQAVIDMSFEKTAYGYQSKRLLSIIRKAKKYGQKKTCGYPVDNSGTLQNSTQIAYRLHTDCIQSVQTFPENINDLRDFDSPPSLTSITSISNSGDILNKNSTKNHLHPPEGYTSSSVKNMQETDPICKTNLIRREMMIGSDFKLGFHFMKFIDAYPKKVDQMKIEKAANIWKLDKLQIHYAKIISSVDNRIKNSDWKNKIGTINERFIPDPATFLAKKMYDYEFEVALSEEERILSESKKWISEN